MGYTTDFEGSFSFNRPLTVAEKNELDEINDKDWRDDENKPGEYCYRCQWTSNETATALEWDGGEKFYGYVEWLKWLIKNFFKPKEILLNGKVLWFGEESRDLGKIIVKDNNVLLGKCQRG